jgi:hypothetical protein
LLHNAIGMSGEDAETVGSNPKVAYVTTDKLAHIGSPFDHRAVQAIERPEEGMWFGRVATAFRIR